MKITRLKVHVSGYRNVRSDWLSVFHSEYRWRKVRNEFILFQSCCQMCGGLDELQVHHIYPWHDYPHLRYNFNNLLTLCQPCHFRFGHHRNWKNFNEDILELCTTAQAQNLHITWGEFNLLERDINDLQTTLHIGQG